MLGTRTKQVFAYGRRSHRIVNVSEDREHLRNAEIEDKKRDNIFSWSPSPQPARRRKNPPVSYIVSSPESTKKTAAIAKKQRKSPKGVKYGGIKASIPARQPLGQFHANVPNSPAVPPARKKRPVVGINKHLRPHSPFVDVDIVVLDAQGRRLSQEKRISRSDVQANHLAVPLEPRAKIMKAVDPPRKPDGSQVLALDPSKRGTKCCPVIISSDESDTDEDVVPLAKLPRLNLLADDEDSRDFPHPPRTAVPRRRGNIVISPETTPSTSHITSSSQIGPSTSRVIDPPSLPPAPLFVPWTPHPIIITDPLPAFDSPIPQMTKVRKLTPMRSRRGRASIFPAPPSPPSPTTPTDLELSLDFSNLALSPSARDAVEGFGTYILPQPEYLQPLLEECAQDSPHEFSAFIDMFPFDPIVHTVTKGKTHFHKIGEASYSEVFGIGDVVLKIIPLRDEDKACDTKVSAEEDMDSPAPSDAKDVLKEIIVTRAMGDMCAGFVKLLRTYIVRGKYPSLLLDLWDDFNEKKGSEGVRPDSFSVSQVYAIIVLPNGGPDLEAYTFKAASKTGWKQACSLFWQITRALAEAEDLVCFEHRDLHWGQILVKDLEPPTQLLRKSKGRIPMDHTDHGVEATVIDLGLARMDSADGDVNETHWTPFDPEIFEGEGDYQFDVYRMMRVHNGNSWEDYRSLTNVMWLHYLSLKLLHFKRLRPPATARKNAVPPVSPIFTERECYECLTEIEEMLRRCVAVCKPVAALKKGRRKTQAPVKAAPSGLKSASDVLRLGIKRGWIL